MAQVEVSYSNSMVEAWWRSLKHQWLFLNSLDTVDRLRMLVAFFVEAHNTQMPHAAFAGHTPDEIYLGTAPNLAAELAVTRTAAASDGLPRIGLCRAPDVPNPRIRSVLRIARRASAIWSRLP